MSMKQCVKVRGYTRLKQLCMYIQSRVLMGRVSGVACVCGAERATIYH